MSTLDYPKVRRAGTWFDVRRRQLGMWAYALNRVTGIGLVAYLYIHLVVLSMLSGGPSSWDSFVALARTPIFLSLDVILLAGMLIHGLNGLRVALTGVGVAVYAQKPLFVGFMIVSAVALGAAILKIFGG